jgi:hypothetical protein
MLPDFGHALTVPCTRREKSHAPILLGLQENFVPFSGDQKQTLCFATLSSSPRENRFTCINLLNRAYGDW